MNTLNAFTIKSVFFSLLLSCSIFTSYGQIHIGSGATLSTGMVTVSTNGTVLNEGNGLWKAGSMLYLHGSGSIASTNPWSLSNLKLAGEYDLDGSITIHDALELEEGHITPSPEAVLMVASEGNIVSQNNAHINGKLFREGIGEKFFPLGKNGIYTPVTLTAIEGDADVVVGIEAFNENLNPRNLPAGVGSASRDWYWELSNSGQFDGSPVQLPFTQEDKNNLSADMNPSVLQANGDATNVLDLGSMDDPAIDPVYINSQLKASGPYLLLGFESEAAPAIHNIISPTLIDGKNDGLYIKNFEAYKDDNLVILLDRWGTEICRIENFSNDAKLQMGCDIEKLPAGNYICIVKYGNKELAPTMISIIK